MSWRKVPLSTAYWFQEGPGVRNWQFTKSGIKLLNVGNITKLGTIDLDSTDKYLSVEEVKEKYHHFLVDEGDLVIASSGISFDTDGYLRTRGAFIERKHLPLCMNTSTIRFKSKKGISDLSFFKFWLNSFEFRSQISRLVTGSAQQNFGPAHLRSISISLPSIDEQKQIASILMKSDRLRRIRRYARQLGEIFLQSVFLNMFGNPKYNPKNWPMYQLGKVGILERGRSKNRPRNAPELYGGKYPFIQTGDVANSDGYIRTYQQTYSEIGLKQSKLWRAGTLCITIAANIAKTSIMTFDACFPDSVVGFIPNKEIKLEYVKYWFSFIQKELEIIAPQSAQKNINLEILRKLEIPVPPFAEQELFAQLVMRYNHLRLEQNEADRQAEELFQSLLQKSFGGEL